VCVELQRTIANLQLEHRPVSAPTSSEDGWPLLLKMVAGVNAPCARCVLCPLRLQPRAQAERGVGGCICRLSTLRSQIPLAACAKEAMQFFEANEKLASSLKYVWARHPGSAPTDAEKQRFIDYLHRMAPIIRALLDSASTD
jgi:hypothetical protein